MTTNHPVKTVEERFWSKVDKDRSDGCWLWMAALTTNGYGQFNWKGRPIRAHRFAYQSVKGPIADEIIFDHLCRVRRCVNPEHLEIVTTRTNTLRGIGISAINARKTHCTQGHPFDLFNTYVRSNGRRHCRTCDRLRYQSDHIERRKGSAQG